MQILSVILHTDWVLFCYPVFRRVAFRFFDDSFQNNTGQRLNSERGDSYRYTAIEPFDSYCFLEIRLNFTRPNTQTVDICEAKGEKTQKTHVHYIKRKLVVRPLVQKK